MHPLELSSNVFFQMWQNRFSPYQSLQEGDLVHIGDPNDRTIYASVRVDSLLTGFGYSSHRQALDALKAAYGLYPEDLNDYWETSASRGWLLAWAPAVMAMPKLRLPEGVRFGQNGYRALGELDSWAAEITPAPDEKPLATPPTWFDPSRARGGDDRELPRHIPLHVRRAVMKRDGYRCVACPCTTNLHLDYIIPFAHGGTGDADNLRVVCAKSNFEKGAHGPSHLLACREKCSERGVAGP
jgi:hypothetical protein